jgi:two-component system NtrC family sensor kinase
MIASSLPIWTVDVLGSICMIVLSFLCLRLAGLLRRGDPNNIIWTFLFWVCTGLTVFAVSRSAGHIFKQVMILSGQASVWEAVRPYSGAINTFTFVVVGAITLFFERTWSIYRQINRDKQDLQAVRDKLLYLNQNLENLIQARTAELTQSEHKYRRIFEVSRDMIVVTRKNGEIVDINPAGCEMLAFEKPACGKPGQFFQEFFVKTEDWDAVLEKVAADGFVSNAEIELRSTDNYRMRTLLSASLDRRLPEKEDTVHLLVKDIEQKRLAE